MLLVAGQPGMGLATEYYVRANNLEAPGPLTSLTNPTQGTGGTLSETSNLAIFVTALHHELTLKNLL